MFKWLTNNLGKTYLFNLNIFANKSPHWVCTDCFNSTQWHVLTRSHQRQLSHCYFKLLIRHEPEPYKAQELFNPETREQRLINHIRGNSWTGTELCCDENVSAVNTHTHSSQKFAFTIPICTVFQKLFWRFTLCWFVLIDKWLTFTGTISDLPVNSS